MSVIGSMIYLLGKKKMDKQAKWFLGLLVVSLGVAALVVVSMWTYSPTTTPSPFEPNARRPSPFEPNARQPSPFEPNARQPSPFEPTVVPTLAQERVVVETNNTTTETTSAAEMYAAGMYGGGGSRSSPHAAAPINEAETIAAVAFGLVAIAGVLYVRRAG